MTIREQIEILGRITTRDEQGRHFTAIYRDADLDDLENAALIRIDRPIHKGTGLPFGREHWTVEITGEGQDLVDQGWSF